MDYYVPFAIRDGLILLAFLAGMGAGVWAITQNHRTTGVLMLIAFALFSLDPVADIVIFQILSRNYTGDSYDIFNWSYACISAFAILLGVAALIGAFVSFIRNKNFQELSPDQVVSLEK